MYSHSSHLEDSRQREIHPIAAIQNNSWLVILYSNVHYVFISTPPCCNHNTPEDISQLQPLCGLTGKSKLCSPGRGSVNFIPSAVLFS